MKICEIFYSIQGEGTEIGKPSIFIRTAGCNFRCSFCDTPYSWGEGTEISSEEIIEKIKEYPCKHIIFTGGEPLLQQKEISKLMKKLNDYTFSIETNGSYELNSYLLAHASVIAISPKFEKNYQQFFVADIYKDKPSVIYKLVMDGNTNPNEFCKKYNIPHNKIYLMPEAKTRKEYIQRAIPVIKYCKLNGFNFSPREHIILWNKKRGI